MQLLHVGHRLFGAADIGFGDDLHQRRAGAIQVNAGGAGIALVQRLAGILFQMRAGHADALGAAVLELDIHMAVLDDRQFELRNLIALGQVGIEIVLAREHAALGDLRINRQAELHGHGHGILVQHRQHAGHAQVHRAGLAVRRRAVGGAGAGENLGFGTQLGVNFQPDDDFPFHYSKPSGVRVCQSVACWYWCATFSRRPSSK